MATLGTLIEYRDAANLTAYARNARTHSADQIADIATSMREWGWTMPVLVAGGDAVYDPFVGSGTTIIAAEMTGRRCFAIEINPAYVDVSVMRWQNVTGLRAVHEPSGQTFASVREDRAGGAAADEDRAAIPLG